MTLGGIPAALLLAVSASAADVVGQAAALSEGLRPELAAVEMDAERTMGELEASVGQLEELAKSYPSSSDLEKASSARDGLRARIVDQERVAREELDRFEDLRKTFEVRQGARILTEMIGLKRSTPSRELKRAGVEMVQGRGPSTASANVDEALELRQLQSRFADRLGEALRRVQDEEKSFERERASRARVRRVRAGLAAGCGLALGAAWLALRRRPSTEG